MESVIDWTHNYALSPTTNAVYNLDDILDSMVGHAHNNLFFVDAHG